MMLYLSASTILDEKNNQLAVPERQKEEKNCASVRLHLSETEGGEELCWCEATFIRDREPELAKTSLTSPLLLLVTNSLTPANGTRLVAVAMVMESGKKLAFLSLLWGFKPATLTV